MISLIWNIDPNNICRKVYERLMLPNLMCIKVLNDIRYCFSFFFILSFNERSIQLYIFISKIGVSNIEKGIRIPAKEKHFGVDLILEINFDSFRIDTIFKVAITQQLLCNCCVVHFTVNNNNFYVLNIPRRCSKFFTYYVTRRQ